jgi:hypothetical protein
MTSDQTESQASEPRPQISALEGLNGPLSTPLRRRFGDDRPQPSRDELQRLRGEQLRSESDTQPMSKMFF